jgi:hypothetical protein
MGKKKGPAWQLFKDNNKGGVVCKYCNLVYKHANVNKMTNHIRKCFKCPEETKKVLVQPKTVNATVGHSIHNSCTKKYPKKQEELTDVSFEMEESNPGPSSSSSSSPMFNLTSPSGKSDHFTFSLPRPPRPSSSIPRQGLLTFLDHMDSQLNVSKIIHFLNYSDLTL